MVKKATHFKIKELQLRSLPANELRYEESKDYKLKVQDRTVKGYLVVWGVRDTHGTTFVKGSCTKSIKERGPNSSAYQKILFLWQHRGDEPIGQFTVLEEDDYGLYFEAVLDEIPEGERALIQINSGTLNQFSIGFRYLWDRMEYDEEEDLIVIYECHLLEGSVVTFASNDQTHAVRSIEQLHEQKTILDDDTEFFIRGLPKNKQLELRQLITRHVSLATIRPETFIPPDTGEPEESSILIGGYTIDTKQFLQ